MSFMTSMLEVSLKGAFQAFLLLTVVVFQAFLCDPGSHLVNISHLLFADNTLVFCEANSNHLLYLRGLLLCF